MTSDVFILGIDIGTSSCKVDAFRPDGTTAASASASYEVICPAPGVSEQRPDDWWNGVCAAIHELIEKGGINPEKIAVIGLDGQSWSAIAIDGDGKVLCNTPIWTDMRSTKQCEWALQRISADEFFESCGNPVSPSYAMPKVLWYRDNLPDVYRRADKILQSNAFIAYRLTGAIVQDVCQGYGFQCFDMRRGIWNEAIVSELEIRRSLLPEFVECDQIVGKVNREAAIQTGLCEGIPVVIGGLDAACGSLGAGVYKAGQTQEQGGQAGGMSICTDEMVADKRLILSRHVIPGKFLLQGGTVGGSGALRWMSEQLCAAEQLKADQNGTGVFIEMSSAAETVEAGSNGMIFLPYMSGERSPIWNPKAEGVFYGVDFSKTRAHMIRAVMEGVAYSLRHNCEIAAEAGATIGRMFSMGGASNSMVWTQIKADVTGYPIDVPATGSATTLGAAILAGVSAGIYNDYESAVNQCISFKRSHTPDADVKKTVYDGAYERYLDIYRSLEHLMV